MGLVLVFWFIALFATATGSKWASEALLSELDYSQILAPYLLTVASVFFGSDSVVLGFVVVVLAKNVAPGP